MPMLAVTNTSPSMSATGPGDRLGQPLGHELGGLLAGHVVAQDGELVAAEAGDDVGRAHGRAQPVGHRDQQPVAGGVAEAVVHHLEAVEVEEQHRDALVALRRRRCQLAARARSTKCSAVGQAGERIVDRLVRERLTARPALGDVLDLADEVQRLVVDVAHERRAHRHPHRVPVVVQVALLELAARDRAGEEPAHRLATHLAVVGVAEVERSTTPSSSRLAASEDLHQRAVHAEQPAVDRR